MSILAIKDTLELAEEFERRLEAYYADLRDRAENDGVRLLTQYLARHTRRVAKALEDYEAAELRRMECIPVKCNIAPFDPKSIFAGKRLPDTVKAEEVLDQALEFSAHLNSFYQSLMKLPLGSGPRELFECLHGMAVRDGKELSKIKNINYF